MDGDGEQRETGYQVTWEPLGLRFAAPPSQPLLVSAAQAGLELPSSCRNGSCRTCIARLRQGRVSYRIEWPGLLPEEKREGWILPCVAHPDTDLTISRT
jgi:ferredoxin